MYKKIQNPNNFFSPHHNPLPQHIGVIESHVGLVDTQKWPKNANGACDLDFDLVTSRSIWCLTLA